MPLGNLAIKVSADIGGFTSNMDIASRSARSSMGASMGAVDDFRASLLKASDDIQRAALNITSNMQAANEAIMAGADQSAGAIQKIADTADAADFVPLGERIAEAIGKGIGVGIVAAQTAWDGFVAYSKTKAVVVGLAVSAAFAAVGLGAVYTAYKVISSSMGFITGLLTGESYKSDNINALIEANNQVKEIQASLGLTAQQAASTNAALAAMGVDKSAYISTFTAAADAVRSNTDEFKRLGVAYQDAEGKLLPLEEVLRNVHKVLEGYTEGWDRNKAATALGLGSAAQVAAAASVSAQKIAEARERLNDYNLGIGPETQSAVKDYEDAMRDFNRETDLTSQGFKRAIADNIMPLLTDLAVFFKDGFPIAVNAFRYSIAVLTSLFYGLKEVIYIVSESIVGSLSAMGTGLGALARASAKAFKGDFSGAKNELIQGWEEAKNRLSEIGTNITAQTNHNVAAMRQAWAIDDRTSDVKKVVTGNKWVDKEKPKAAVKDPFDTEMFNVGRTQAGIDFAIANFDKFQGKVKESKAAMAEFDVTLGKFSDAQRKAEGFTPLTAAQKADYIARNKLIDQGLETERQLNVLRKFDKAGEQFGFNEKQAIDARRQDIEWMGKGQLELAKLTEARRIDGEVAAMVNQTQIELGKSGLTITSDQIAAIKARAAMAKASQMALLDAQDAKSRDPWFNARESIRRYGEEAANTGAQIGNSVANGMRSAEDAFVNFAMTGKLNFGDLARSVIADIARMQARAAVSGLFNFAMSAVGSYFGSGSSYGAVDAAQAASGGSFNLSPQFKAGGGFISGPGTGTSDSIPAWLSNGEFVNNAESTRKNRALLEYLNDGGDAAKAPRFATGGFVGSGPAADVMASLGSGGVNVVTNVTINDAGTKSETTGGNGSVGKQLAGMIEQQVKQVLVKEMRDGGLISRRGMGYA